MLHCACTISVVQLLTGTLAIDKGPSVASRSILAPSPILIIRYLQDLSHNCNFVVSTKAYLFQVFCQLSFNLLQENDSTTFRNYMIKTRCCPSPQGRNAGVHMLWDGLEVCVEVS